MKPCRFSRLDQHEQVVRAGPRLRVVVLRDHAALGDPAEVVERADRGLQVLAADVVEVDVDAIGRGGLELLCDRAVVVVERGVEADLVQQIADLLRGSGAADDPGRAAQLGDLTDQRTHRSGRTGDEHDVAFLLLGDVDEPDVRGHAGHAGHVEVGARRSGLRVDLDGVLGVERRVVAPAEVVQHEVTGLETLGVRGDDLADRAALQRLAHLDGRDVGLARVHPAAHVRVDAHPQVADQQLTVAGLGCIDLDDVEVLRRRPALGAGREADFQALVHLQLLHGCGRDRHHRKCQTMPIVVT